MINFNRVIAFCANEHNYKYGAVGRRGVLPVVVLPVPITYAIFRTFEEGQVWLVKQRA